MARPYRWKSRPGYVLVGFCWFFRHRTTGKIIRPRNGRPFPIYRRAS